MARINIQTSAKIFAKSVTTVQVNLNQTSKIARYAQITIPTIMETGNAETHLVFATVVDTGKVYSDQTGHFTVTSSKGVKYVSILYSYEDNAIFQIPSRAEP